MYVEYSTGPNDNPRTAPEMDCKMSSICNLLEVRHIFLTYSEFHTAPNASTGAAPEILGNSVMKNATITIMFGNNQSGTVCHVC